MAQSAGTRLGSYEVIVAIGAGGMSACGRASERSETSPRGAGVGRLRSAKPSFGELRRSFAEARPRAISRKMTPSPCR